MMGDEDLYDFGGDWTPEPAVYTGRINVGAYPAGGGAMNLSPSDPASAYYTGPGSGYGQPASISPMEAPYGGGAYAIGDGDWNSIYAPGGGQGAGSYAPVDYSMSRAAQGGSRPSYMADFSSSNPAWGEMASWGASPGGGGGARPGGASPGARSVAQQTPQMISMGKPEDDLYKRYKSLLMNPDFSGDPTYQFLYNQGLQGLNRNLAARRLNFSGKSMNDTMAYGSGMASKYMQDLLPQYRGGAQEELQRFMGPAGLLPRYAGSNNATIGGANQMVNSADDRAMYADMLAGGNMGGGVSAPQDWGSGIGYGGRTSGYVAPPLPAPTGYAPRPLSYAAADNYDYTDAADNLYDGA